MLASLFVAMARTASAQQTGNCKASKQWQLDRRSRRITSSSSDQVEIDCGDESISADQVEIFNDTNIMIATGNVVFTSGGSRIAADRLEYNTRTQARALSSTASARRPCREAGARAPRRRPRSSPSRRSTASSSGPATGRCSGRRKPTSTSTARRSRRSAQEKYRITKRRLHDLRAADAALAAHVGHGDAEPRTLRVADELVVQGEVRAGAVPSDLLLPDQQGGPRDGLPDAVVRHVHDQRARRSATPSSGPSTAARMRRSSTTGSRRPARASAPSTGMSRRRGPTARSASTT